MRKFLLTLAVLCSTVSGWAGPTDLPEITTDLENPIYYTISNTRSASGKLIYWTKDGIKDANYVTNFNACKFYFVGDSYDDLKIRNAATDLYFAGVGEWAETGVTCKIEVTPHASKAGLAIYFEGTSLNEQNHANGYTTWNANDEGSIFVIQKAEEVLPEVGNTYYIEAPLFHNAQLVKKGLCVNEDGSLAWNTIDPTSNAYKWRLEVDNDGKWAYKNVSSNTYINGSSMSEEAKYGQHNYLGYGQWNIVISNFTIHANGHGSGFSENGNVVSWNGAANSASAWQFVNVDANDAFYANRYHDLVFPFKFTTDDANPILYSIKSGRGAEKWYQVSSDNKIELVAYADKDEQLWYFKKTTDGFVQLFSKEGKVVSYQNTNNGAEKIELRQLGENNWTNTWFFVRTGTEAPYGLRTSDLQNYLSQNGGGNNKMGMWNAKPSDDSGSAMYINTPEGWLTELMKNVTPSVGDGVCSYKSSPEYEQAYSNATAALASSTGLAQAYEDLRKAFDALDLNMPVDGKFYRLRCTGTGMKYLQYTQNTNAKRFDMISGNDGKTVNATFCYTNGGLVAYANPLYINHDDNVASMKMETTNVTFSEATNVTGQYFIKIGGRYLYGDGNNSDSGDGTPDNRAGYRWWLEEVTSLPVTVSAAGYASFYCPVAVTLPEGLKAYYVSGTNESYAKMTEIEGTIPANTGVILEGAEGEYNLEIVDIDKAIEGNMLEGTVASAYVAETSYVLANGTNGVGFYKAQMNQQGNTSFLANGFKAYMPIVSESRFFVFNFGGEETGIDELKGENGNQETEIFDLAGRRVQNAQKGVFIVNGKVVIK